jgi:hypothetical protein
MAFSIADLTAQAAAYNASLPESRPQPELPEFAFSQTRDVRAMFLANITEDFRKGEVRAKHRANHRPIAIRVLDRNAKTCPTGLNMIHGEPVTGLNAAEIGWRQGQLTFKAPVVEHTRPPAGTAPTLEGLQRFLKRMDDYEAEWKAIAATQDMELPTVGQELAATGISSISLVSNNDDDEDDAIPEIADTEERTGYVRGDPIIDHDARRYGTAYMTAELAPLVRRIEWERYIHACGPAQRVYLVIRDDETLGVGTDSHTLTKEDLIPLARKLKQALGERSAADLNNDRIRVSYYGAVGSAIYGVLNGEHTPVQSMDLLGADEQETEERNGGPQELGLHQFYSDTVLGSEDEDEAVDDMRIVAYEPNEATLWPEEVVLIGED